MSPTPSENGNLAHLVLQQWVVITLNLFVHVIMYYYYYATAGGAKIWVSSKILALEYT